MDKYEPNLSDYDGMMVEKADKDVAGKLDTIIHILKSIERKLDNIRLK